jgi:membrane protein involved in colicin uptake
MATIITQQEINDFIKENGIADLLRLIANASNGAVDSVEQIQHADEDTQRDIAVAISTPINAKQAAKLAAKQKKDAEKAEAKAKKEQEKAEAKAKKELEKAEAKAKKDAEKAKAKEAAKAEKLAAKLAAKEAAMAKKAEPNMDAAPLLAHDHNAAHDNTAHDNTAHDNTAHYDILVIDHHDVSENLHTNQFVHSPSDSNSDSGNDSD